MVSPQTGEAANPGIEWRRPHPYTLLVEFVSSLRDLIFPIVIIFSQGNAFTEIFPLLAVLLPFGAALARYYTTRYALTDEALLHEYGVFRKSKQVLPRRNIQNVTTSAGLIARATGLVELTASDASQGGDVKLRLLSVPDAESLLSLLRSSAAPAADLETGADGQGGQDGQNGSLQPPAFGAPVTIPYESEPLHVTQMSDLVKFSGATSGGIFVGPMILMAALIAYFAFPEERDQLSLEMLFFALGPIAAVVLPAINPIFRLGGFRLWSDPDRLRIKTGLLTEIQMNARRERLQLVQVDRHLFAQALGLEGIRFETADVEAGTAAVKFLAPAVAADSWPIFARDALGEVELSEDDLQRVSPLTQRRSLVRWGFGGAVLGVAMLAAAVFAPAANRLAIAILGVIGLLGYGIVARWHAARRARRLGWALGEDQFLFRNGVIAEKLYLIRKEKVQFVRLHQSFFQRRLGLTTLVIATAGLGSLGRVSLPDLEDAVADSLANHLSEMSFQTPLARTL